MILDCVEIAKKKVGAFRFKVLGGKYLLTNDCGEYCYLSRSQFESYLAGTIYETENDLFLRLQAKGFIRDQLNLNNEIRKLAIKNSFIGERASLHIIVLTLRCDHECIYCQADSRNLQKNSLDMTQDTARKVVDKIFESPSKEITIEFQGGEPLVKLDLVKFIVGYAREKNKTAKKDLKFAIVSNFTFMNKKTLNYFFDQDIPLCTSLDGPEELHNQHRKAFKNKNTHRNTVKWLKIILKEAKKRKKPHLRPQALATITRLSLPYFKEIIDEYKDLGLAGIHLRPANNFDDTKNTWKEIGFTAAEFADFYKKCMDYILKINVKGTKFFERTANIFLIKILTDIDPNYLDLRSPCGAGTGQLAYNFDGAVYTCDEGRMLSRRGIELFKVGNVCDHSLEEMSSGDTVKTMMIASCLDTLPICADCAYKPYCGVCPIQNYISNSDIFTRSSFLCQVNTSILDYLFLELLTNKDSETIFRGWVNKRG
jgi:His-Xaa-Ser system radical SAM maturase HxsB